MVIHRTVNIMSSALLFEDLGHIEIPKPDVFVFAISFPIF